MVTIDFYKSKRWLQKREHILRRDHWIDQVKLRDGIRIEADTVHHILPRELWPEYQWCDWNLISVASSTHKRDLHEKFTGKLTKLGKQLAREVCIMQGIKLKTITMVIGMPGTGKSTWAKKHLGGGLCYELDSIACAFRLCRPHEEPVHSGARQMAAALRQGWLAAAHEYADHLIIVRTAPDERELDETRPDKLVVCTKQYVHRPYRYDREDYQRQIEAAVKWAELNGIEIEFTE